MEHINNTIQELAIADDQITLTYDNNETEVISINTESYKKMRTTWLTEQPPFISDKYKKVMNNIILSSIQNKESSIAELKTFFTQENKEEVINFFNYMRSRDLTEEKAKWKKVV